MTEGEKKKGGGRSEREERKEEKETREREREQPREQKEAVFLSMHPRVTSYLSQWKGDHPGSRVP